MPTYQYACTACGHQLEAVQSFTDDALTECPACAGKLRKLFSSVGIVFKGSGFYRTDSRSGSSGAEGAAAKESTGKDSTSKESTAAPSTSSESSSTSSAATTTASGSGGSATGSSTAPAKAASAA